MNTIKGLCINTAGSFMLLSRRCLLPALLVLAISIDGMSAGSMVQKGRKGGKAPNRPAPASSEAASESPGEAFERARSAATQDERIKLLERFVAAHRDAGLEKQARDLLMREYALRGEQHLREGNPQPAMRDFKAVFNNAPAEINDRVFGQFIFPLPLAMSAFGYRVESVELMQSFESRFERDPNRLVQIGFFYVQIEAPIEAVRVLEHAVAIAPDNHRAHNGLGSAYLINLRLEEAMSEFERALEIDPADEFANLNLANLARAGGDHKRAITYYNKQIALKPDDAEAHGGLALSLLALGRNEEADAEIKRAAELAPEDYRLMTQLAFFYTNRRKPLVARPYMERAAHIEPRYAWTFIAKANIDAVEGKYGDALATIIQAQTLAGFATLKFELVKALMTLDGYDQALDVIKQNFTISDEGEFETLLGGVVKARSPSLDLLLERERKAALFSNDYPTTTMQYRLAEALARMDHYANVMAKARKPAASTGRRGARGGGKQADDSLKNATRPRRASPPINSNELSAGADSSLPGAADLIKAVKTFTTLDDGRQAFRMIVAARKLTELEVALDAAEQLSRRAIEMADSATEPDGSMRDAPLLDRQGRRDVFLGRAYDALGWILFKKGDTRAALETLAKAVQVYPDNLERKTALWHLAVATEQVGDEKRALDFYIASFEPGSPTESVRRAQIESLYKKLNGSLTGLKEKLESQ